MRPISAWCAKPGVLSIFLAGLWWYPGSLGDAAAAPPAQEPPVVSVAAQDSGRAVELQPGQQLEISLESNPSTGYGWEIQSADGGVLRQVGRMEFKPTLAGLAGDGVWTVPHPGRSGQGCSAPRGDSSE